MSNYYSPSIFYLAPDRTDKRNRTVWTYLNADMSIFNRYTNTFKRIIRDKDFEDDIETGGYIITEFDAEKSFSINYFSRTPDEDIGILNSFYQVIYNNNEISFRIALQITADETIELGEPQKVSSARPNEYWRKRYTSDSITYYLIYTQNINDIGYGPIREKLKDVYDIDILKYPNEDYYEKRFADLETKDGAFAIKTQYDHIPDVVYYKSDDDISFELQDDDELILIYLGRDKDYYYASSDLMIYKNYFCLEAISNHGEQVILKSNILKNNSQEKLDSKNKKYIIDSIKYDSPTIGFCNHDLIVEKLCDSEISTIEFKLANNPKRLEHIKEVSKNIDYNYIEETMLRYHWNKETTDTLGGAFSSGNSKFDSWLDNVHESGYDDNDLV